MNTIILGLGNPIVGDDQIGCLIADKLHQMQDGHSLLTHVEIGEFYQGGIALMEHLIGYDKAILIDAMETEGGQPGTIHAIGVDDLPTFHTNSSHNTTLKNALIMGRDIGEKLPETIRIIAIEINKAKEFTQSLTPAVKESIDQAIKTVLKELEDLHPKQ